MNSAEQRLQAVFSDIAATRMAGLPICNAALRVQVVGFREWPGHRLGVLVTPWTISLVLMQGDEVLLQTLGADEKMSWDFPSGSYEFMG
ncbi:MAG: [NiFe]-hydrogenase assembly chaperone HybE, partial [Gallionella sp.]